MIHVRFPKLLACVLVLTACTPAPQEPLAVEATLTPVPAAVQASPYDTDNSIEDLMTSLVMPNAELLWNAVSYIATAQGVTETMPETDDDWTRLRASAITLIEAGNMLMVPGREILTNGGDPAAAGFLLAPDEIALLIADDFQSWQGYAQSMQESTRMTLQAIELRDIMGLTEWGAEINEACDACHAQYWYRPLGVMAPQ